MQLRLALAAIAAIVVYDGAPAQTRTAPGRAGNKGHCTPDEVVVFSCTVRGGKIASLCASTDLSETAGTLTYRFGPRGKPELVHPASPQAPQKVFSYSALPRGDAVHFTREGTVFSIYSVNEVGRRDEDGVLVRKPGAKPVDLKCIRFGLGDLGWRPVYNAKLPRTEVPFERP